MFVAGASSQLDHLAFAVRGADALAEVRERLRTGGIRMTELDVSADPGLSEGIALSLPAGHVVELVVESDPVGYVGVSAAAVQHHRGVGPVQIEHVTLLADDIRANVELAVERLGFRITESVQPRDGPWRNTHLRAGELHHDLAFLPANTDKPELHHFCFAVASVIDLIRIADALAARGMTLDSSIGRHAGGNNIFLYFKDPFGNRVEVNTDMARINSAAPPRVLDAPVPFDAWRTGRPPAMTAGSPARDGRM
jgi:catechol 2,3-dioxygenase